MYFNGEFSLDNFSSCTSRLSNTQEIYISKLQMCEFQSIKVTHEYGNECKM